jgi:hypothetical protein
MYLLLRHDKIGRFHRSVGRLLIANTEFHSGKFAIHSHRRVNLQTTNKITEGRKTPVVARVNICVLCLNYWSSRSIAHKYVRGVAPLLNESSFSLALCLSSISLAVFLYQTEHKQTNSVALSPRANYTDWSTATCRRNLVPTFVDRGVSRGQRGGSPTVVNLSFLDRSR